MSTQNKKTMSRDEKLAIIKSVMVNHDCLNPQLFGTNNLLLPKVREKLLEIADFVSKRYLKSFTQAKVQDIRLNGGACSYLYNDKTDVDLFIVTDLPISLDTEFTESVHNALRIAIIQEDILPFFYGHFVDFFVLSENSANWFNCYSLLQDKWITSPPVRQDFPFTPEELYQEFATYSAELHRFVAALEKTEQGFLTTESSNALVERLNKIQKNAFVTKRCHEKHEYSLEYTIYRLLKKFGMYAHFSNYIRDSQKGSMNQNGK